MKKLLLGLLVAVFCLTGCGQKAQSDVIKVGLSGSDSVVWEQVKKTAKEQENIDIELVYFNDYVQPNLALQEGEIDINAFQTIAFLEETNEKNGWNLVPVATTVKAPMGIYSTKHKTLTEIPNGAKIAIPNEGSNKKRAILLLESEGIIKVKEGVDPASVKTSDLLENPYNIELVELTPNQIPRSLADVDYALINSGVAVDAGYNPSVDAIVLEPASTTDYVNVIAAREDCKKMDDVNKIIKIYQSEEIEKLIIEDSKGSSIPTFIPVSDVVKKK